jgi:GGDEF domain-containing protein
VIWLFLFYNIERLSKSVDFTTAAYILVPVVAVVAILVPRLHKVPLGVLLTVPVVTFLVLKNWLEGQVGGTTLPLTITEACTIVLTLLLVRRVNAEVGAFESAVDHIVMGDADKLSDPLSTSEAEMYRELRRARRYSRPLAMVSIGVEDGLMQVALDRIVQEVQQATMKRYVLSNIANTLCDELDDHNIIAYSNDHFLVLLPEVTAEELPQVADDLRDLVSERVGVTPQIGSASFPDDAATFSSLVGKAMGEMKREQELERFLQSQQEKNYTMQQ